MLVWHPGQIFAPQLQIPNVFRSEIWHFRSECTDSGRNSLIPIGLCAIPIGFGYFRSVIFFSVRSLRQCRSVPAIPTGSVCIPIGIDHSDRKAAQFRSVLTTPIGKKVGADRIVSPSSLRADSGRSYQDYRSETKVPT